MPLELPDRPAQYLIDAVLLPNWDSDVIDAAKGYDPAASPGDEAFLPVATTIDDVGAVYPSLIITYSNETSGGETSYDFLTEDGPGQDRQGTLVATVRAQDSDAGYTGDSNQHAAEPAEDIVVHIVEAVERLIQQQAAAPGTEFRSLGSQRGADAPDDTDTEPPTRLANTDILYSWGRRP